jgi:hypothetical protein
MEDGGMEDVHVVEGCPLAHVGPALRAAAVAGVGVVCVCAVDCAIPGAKACRVIGICVVAGAIPRIPGARACNVVRWPVVYLVDGSSGDGRAENYYWQKSR